MRDANRARAASSEESKLRRCFSIAPWSSDQPLQRKQTEKMLQHHPRLLHWAKIPKAPRQQNAIRLPRLRQNPRAQEQQGAIRLPRLWQNPNAQKQQNAIRLPRFRQNPNAKERKNALSDCRGLGRIPMCNASVLADGVVRRKRAAS